MGRGGSRKTIEQLERDVVAAREKYREVYGTDMYGRTHSGRARLAFQRARAALNKAKLKQ